MSNNKDIVKFNSLLESYASDKEFTSAMFQDYIIESKIKFKKPMTRVKIGHLLSQHEDIIIVKNIHNRNYYMKSKKGVH